MLRIGYGEAPGWGEIHAYPPPVTLLAMLATRHPPHEGEGNDTR